MKSIFRILLIIFLVIIAFGIGSISQLKAEEGSCYLQANDDDDVSIIVYDLDRDGNQGSVIWQGRINKGESILISTPHGRFRYDYNSQPDLDQPFSGGYDRWCNNKETVLVP